MITFEFTREERLLAAREGQRRHQWARQYKSKGNNFAGHDGTLHTEMIGAAGEMAVASYLGLKEHLYTLDVPVKDSFDLPPNIDVKARTGHHAQLILHANDRLDHKCFWLVTFENRTCYIHGWIDGLVCSRTDWLRHENTIQPCYYVPQQALHPPASWHKAPPPAHIFAANEFGF